MRNTVALFSSSRRHGNTGRLMDRVAQELGIEVVDLANKNIAHYSYNHDHRGDDFEPLMTRLLDIDQIIFASPVYWYSVSPPMKIFLDRISDYLELPELLDQGRRLRGKAGFVLCTSIMDEPAPSFLDMFKQTFDYLGMHYGGSAHANCAEGYDSSRDECDVQTFCNLLRSGSVTA